MFLADIRNPLKSKEKIRVTELNGPLAKAIAQQSAEWLESVYPSVYDALQQELAAGRTIEDIQRMLRRIFGWDVREQFQLRVLQAAEHMMTEQIGGVRGK